MVSSSVLLVLREVKKYFFHGEDSATFLSHFCCAAYGHYISNILLITVHINKHRDKKSLFEVHTNEMK